MMNSIKARENLGNAIGFLCSRSTSSSAILPSLDWAATAARGSSPIASTFHSKLEVAVLDVLLRGTCPIILVLARQPYKILPDKLKEAVASGRLEILPVSDDSRISKESALQANQYICEHAQSLTFGFLSQESSLYPLYLQAAQSGKHIDILSSSQIFPIFPDLSTKNY